MVFGLSQYKWQWNFVLFYCINYIMEKHIFNFLASRMWYVLCWRGFSTLFEAHPWNKPWTQDEENTSISPTRLGYPVKKACAVAFAIALFTTPLWLLSCLIYVCTILWQIFWDYICYFSLLLCSIRDLGVVLLLKFPHGTFVKVGEFSLKFTDWGNISIHRCIFANLKSINWCPFLVSLSFLFLLRKLLSRLYHYQ